MAKRRAAWPEILAGWMLPNAAAVAPCVVVLGATVRLADTRPLLSALAWVLWSIDRGRRSRRQRRSERGVGPASRCTRMPIIGPVLAGLVALAVLLGMWSLTLGLEPLVVTAHLQVE